MTFSELLTKALASIPDNDTLIALDIRYGREGAVDYFMEKCVAPLWKEEVAKTKWKKGGIHRGTVPGLFVEDDDCHYFYDYINLTITTKQIKAESGPYGKIKYSRVVTAYIEKCSKVDFELMNTDITEYLNKSFDKDLEEYNKKKQNNKELCAPYVDVFNNMIKSIDDFNKLPYEVRRAFYDDNFSGNRSIPGVNYFGYE